MAEVSEGWVCGRPRLGLMGVKMALGSSGITVEVAQQSAKRWEGVESPGYV